MSYGFNERNFLNNNNYDDEEEEEAEMEEDIEHLSLTPPST